MFMRFQGKIPSSRGRSHNGNLRVGGTLMPDPTLQDFSGRGAEDRQTLLSPKNFRYLNFGISSFIFRLFGINKNYLLIIKNL